MLEYVIFSLADLLEKYDEGELNKIFQSFECKKEKDLEHFLQKKACVYENSNVGRTFLFIDEKELNNRQFKIMGFFTIAQTSYDISNMSQKKKRKVLGSSVPGRDTLNSFPAFLIGQIGRCDSYSSQDLPGHILLHECYLQLKEVSKIVGGEHVILECRECMFGKFYNNQGFKKISKEPDKNGLLTLYNRIKFKEIQQKEAS